MSTVRAYQMNPAEDYLVFGDELADGMWVVREDESLRADSDMSEDEQLRQQRFCRVTKIRRSGDLISFIGEWIDGYQQAFRMHQTFAWIVKRDPITAPDAMFREITEAGGGEHA
jgi:hypothetical protein